MTLSKNRKSKIIIYSIIILLFINGCTSSDNSIKKISFEKTHLANDCSFDKYNCDDFATQKEAQQIFEKCGYDVHRLDRDKDGKACEN